MFVPIPLDDEEDEGEDTDDDPDADGWTFPFSITTPIHFTSFTTLYPNCISTSMLVLMESIETIWMPRLARPTQKKAGPAAQAAWRW